MKMEEKGVDEEVEGGIIDGERASSPTQRKEMG